MAPLRLFKDYLVWHYSSAYNDMFHIWWNYLWFVNHLFSVPEVFGSLLSPWKRLQEDKVSILLHPEEFFGNLFVNIIMRLVGLVVRTALLVIALLCFLIVLIGGILFFTLWTALPILLAHFLISGIKLFIL